MFQQEQKYGRHGFNQNFLVSIDVDAQLHRLQHGHPIRDATTRETEKLGHIKEKLKAALRQKGNS